MDTPDAVYQTDRWSRYLWHQHIDNNQTLQGILGSGSEKVLGFPSFSREVFHRLYSHTPDLLKSVKPEHAWALKAHQELGELPAFKHLASRCTGDKFLSGIAATTFTERALEGLPRPPKPLEDPELLRQQVRGLLDLARQLNKDGDTKQAQKVEKLVEKVRDQGRKAVRASEEYASGIDPSDLRNNLRAAIRHAENSVDEFVEQWSAFSEWGSGCGGDSRSGGEVKAELARRIRASAKLRRLAKEAGRLRRVAAAKQRSKTKHSSDEVADVELGNDTSRLLPSEVVKLCTPGLFLDFARKFHERSLLQYRLTGTEAQGRGPLVVCVDSSGSMRGSKEIWSKAFALALLQVAALQKRHCRVVHFNTDVVRVDDWPPGRVEPLRLLESMEPFWGGGTSFTPPLTTALEAIQQNDKLKLADVVLVTDGQAELPDDFVKQWKEAKKKYQFTTYAVHVDSPGGIPPAALAGVADKTIGLADLADDRSAADAVLTL